MASGPITSWQIEGEKVKTVIDFIFLGSKITVDGECSHEIKRGLLLGRKIMTNLDSILKKQKHYIADKDPFSHNYGFSSSQVWMSELDQRISAFELWCWRRLLRVPWTARRSNQSILKEINPEYSTGRTDTEAPILGHLMQRADSLEKTLTLEKIEGRRR